MRDTNPPAIIEKTVDLKKVAAEARKLNVAIRDGEALVERETESLAQRRERLGKLLVEGRRGFNARGDGFVKWIEGEIGIEHRTALNYMTAVGYIGGGSNQHTAKDQRKSFADLSVSPIEAENPRAPSREEFEASAKIAWEREVQSRLPPTAEQRDRRAAPFIDWAAAVASIACARRPHGVHLTDVTTDASEFERTKQNLCAVVRVCLDELEMAGVLDGKEKRRQLTLLDGGKK